MILKLILNDGTQIELADASYMSQFVVNCNGREEFDSIWSSLTEANLSDVVITSDGVRVHHMSNLVLDGAQAIIDPRGTITGHFYFHGASTVNDAAESEYVTVAKILLGEEE